MARTKKQMHQFPYRIDTGFELVVAGRWSAGGAAEVLHKATLVDNLIVPRGEFVLLATLMQAAEQAAFGQGAKAFVLSEVLARELLRLAGLGDNDPQNVHKTIDKLRKRLMRSRVTAFASRAELQWSDDIVETHPTLGYRISLPHENQHLELLDPA